MHKIGSTLVALAVLLFIAPCGSAEIKTLGFVENGKGTLDLKQGSWDLSGKFNDVGPVFKDPNVLESDGNLFENVWKIKHLETGTAIVEGNVIELPWITPIHEGGNAYRIEDGIIYLNSNIYKDLTFTFSGSGRLQTPEADQRYTVNSINGELTYDQPLGNDDNTPDDSGDSESGGSGGCFISSIKAFME